MAGGVLFLCSKRRTAEKGKKKTQNKQNQPTCLEAQAENPQLTLSKAVRRLAIWVGWPYKLGDFSCAPFSKAASLPRRQDSAQTHL